MATITTTTYRSDNNGSSWYSRPSGTASYIDQKGYTNQTCFSFNYAPVSGNKATKMVFTCSIMAQNGASWNGPYTAELYLSNLPDGNPVVVSEQVTPSLTSSAYTDVSFTIDIPDTVSIASTTDLCIGIYGPFSLGHNGIVEITEVASYKLVNIGNGSAYDKYSVHIADTLLYTTSQDPVEITNISARGLHRQNGTVSYGNWDATQVQVGYYSSSVSYGIQLRFRLNKACSSIRLCVQGASESAGTYYFKVSDNVQDDNLVTRMLTEGNDSTDTAVTIDWNGTSYYGESVINGYFPADTDLYIYGHRYATSFNTTSLFGLYDSDRYSKVIDATSIDNSGTEIASFSAYAPYIGDGTNWIPYNG